MLSCHVIMIYIYAEYHRASHHWCQCYSKEIRCFTKWMEKVQMQRWLWLYLAVVTNKHRPDTSQWVTYTDLGLGLTEPLLIKSESCYQQSTHIYVDILHFCTCFQTPLIVEGQVTLHSGPNWWPSCLNSKFINKSCIPSILWIKIILDA